jgi:hypothetical protein
VSEKSSAAFMKFTRMIKAVGSSETSVQFYQTVLRRIENAVVFIVSARRIENLAWIKLFFHLRTYEDLSTPPRKYVRGVQIRP